MTTHPPWRHICAILPDDDPACRIVSATEFDPRYRAAQPGDHWPASWNIHGRAVLRADPDDTVRYLIRAEPGEPSP